MLHRLRLPAGAGGNLVTRPRTATDPTPSGQLQRRCAQPQRHDLASSTFQAVAQADMVDALRSTHDQLPAAAAIPAAAASAVDVDRRRALMLMLALLPSLVTSASLSTPAARAEDAESAPPTPAVEAGSTPAAGSGTPSIQTVFVAGSTGQTGRRLVSELRARGFQVKAGVRDLKKGQALGLALDPGVQLVQADVLDPKQLAQALIGVQAVICATGYTGFNPAGFGEVDETGTKNLVEAAKKAQVQHFVLLSSLLTNAPAVGQANNPNYKFLNLFGAVLDHKLVAEKYLRDSGLTWTIVRPGGLSNDPPAKVGSLVVSTEDTLFGLEGDAGREVSRDTVAQVLAAALQQPSADNKVVEVVASASAAPLPEASWFP